MMDMTKPDMTKMRRADRAISREDALAVIDRCAYGTLSLIATDGTPYAVALNVVRDGEKLFFHSAMAGLKVNSLRENPQQNSSGSKARARRTAAFCSFRESSP